MTGHPLPLKHTGTDQAGPHAAEPIDDGRRSSIGKGPDSRLADLDSTACQRRTFASIIARILAAHCRL